MNKEDAEGVLYITAMRGLPRSGKSTRAKKIAAMTGACVVSRDAIRLGLHGEPFIAEREEEVQEIEAIMIRSLFFSGTRQIILDECNIKRSKTDTMLKQVLEPFGIKYCLEYITVDASKEVCIKRAIECKQEYLLPVIESMDNQWED